MNKIFLSTLILISLACLPAQSKNFDELLIESDKGLIKSKKEVIIPKGTILNITSKDRATTKYKPNAEREVLFRLAKPYYHKDKAILPAGTKLKGIAKNIKKPAKNCSSAKIHMKINKIEANKNIIPIKVRIKNIKNSDLITKNNLIMSKSSYGKNLNDNIWIIDIKKAKRKTFIKNLTKRIANLFCLPISMPVGLIKNYFTTGNDTVIPKDTSFKIELVESIDI